MNILIIGGSSLIAQNVAYIYSKDLSNKIILTSRNLDKAKIIAEDLKIRTNNQNIFFLEFNPNDFNSHLEFKEKVLNIFDIDLLIISYGNLSSNKDVGYNYEKFLNEININFLSVCSIIYTFIDFFTTKQKGKIAVITSVAGVRARYSNYIYGVGKGSLILFLQGLRSNLIEKNVQIIDIRPGLVDTPMTKNIKKSFLFASPEKVAKDIVIGISKNKDIIYTPYFWKIVMMVIKLIPEKIFKKLKF